MTAVEWEQYGDLCASRDEEGLKLSVELRAHMREQFSHNQSEGE